MPRRPIQALKKIPGFTIGIVIGLWLTAPVFASEVRIAVAANFTEAAREIGAAFEQTTGHRVVFSFGSTGQFYTQIAQGAPFEVFLAADRARPARAVAEDLAMPGSQFTYATGRIVLFSREKDLVSGGETLHAKPFTRLAIANPNTAPYGAAAVETMRALGIYDALVGKLVRGNNIAQTYQFVDTRNAELGFVALSQIVRHDEGSRWLVPEALYSPIAQDAVLLREGASNEAAVAFLSYLKSPEANAVKQKFGYGPGDWP